ncbi:MAG: esterase [Gammaproteobacteria bacterium HGW-Gammaproteobacteria-6]|nr:MAG: esterase [Gammaproteobacteria bacterium HGW-Gammaproteobacteria-6]
MPPSLRYPCLLLVLLLQACSPLAPLNLIIPDSSYRVLNDQAYGDQPRQKLDVYFPRQGLQEAPVVVFYYGGSWRGGKRENYVFVAEALARRGIITVVADYRVYPEVRYPDFLIDSAAALAWVEEARQSWQQTPQPLFVMGHSAGAYNAAMLALDQRWLQQQGLEPEVLAGWIGLAGPYDFIPIINPRVKPIFHHPDTPADSQPLFHAGSHSPPALLLAASPDRLVDPQRNTGQMVEALREAGVRVETQVFPSLNHFSIMLAMAKPFEDWEPIADQIAEFVMDPALAP